jgi:hypothetical protein
MASAQDREGWTHICHTKHILVAGVQWIPQGPRNQCFGRQLSDGHVCLSAPYTGNRNDGSMYAATGLYRKLRRLRYRAIDPGFYVLFGDLAFPASEHCHKILPNANETWKKNYNKSMSKLRISAEWMFKDMGQCWHRLHQIKTHRLCGMNVGGRIQLAAILWNCLNSFTGSQTCSYFNLDPIPMEHLLGKRLAGQPAF